MGVYYMCLDSIGYNFGDRKVVLLFVVHFFLVSLVFCNTFGSLLVTLGLCHWGGKYV